MCWESKEQGPLMKFRIRFQTFSISAALTIDCKKVSFEEPDLAKFERIERMVHLQVLHAWESVPHECIYLVPGQIVVQIALVNDINGTGIGGKHRWVLNS